MIKKALLGKYNKTAADIKIRERACERETIGVSLRTPKPDTMRLATLILSLLMTVTAAAQRPDTTYTLEAVSVTGSRILMELGQSARIVSVLDSAAIAAIPASTVTDLLKTAVGVDVRQRGGLGVQSDISIRGGTSDQIAILLNGINISDPQTGHNAADFPVDLRDIRRIEILEGPASRVYGTASLLGAINLVTGTSETGGISARFSGGSYGYVDGGVTFRKAGTDAAGHPVSHQFSASLTRSDGYSRNKAGGLNSDFKAERVFYGGAWERPDFDLNWHIGLSNKDFGANTFYSSRYDDQFEHTLKTFVALQGETKGALHIKPQLYWNRGYDRFELFRDDADKYPFNYHRTDVLGFNLGSWFRTRLGKTAFGAELRNEGILSTNLGEPMDTPKGHYKVSLNRTQINFYAEHNVILPRLTFSAGISAVRNTGNQEGFRFYPGADASFRLSDSWKLYTSWNSSFRMPTFTDLYYSVGGYAADKNLKAEKMQALEAGIKYMRPGIRAILDVFYHHGTDLIDWIKDLSAGPDAPWTSVNHAEINAFGQEVTLRLDLPVLLGKPTFALRSLDLGYSHIRQDMPAESDIQSRYVLEYLRNKAVATADIRILPQLALHLSGRWQDRVGTYQVFDQGTDTGRTASYKPYTLIDARLQWDVSRLTLTLEADNLLNRPYFDHGNIPQPGLWLRLGLQYNL